MLEECSQRCTRLGRERMIRRDDDVERIFPDALATQLCDGFRWKCYHRELDLAAHDCVTSLLGIHEAQIEAHLRIARAKAFQRQRDSMQADMMARRERK